MFTALISAKYKQIFLLTHYCDVKFKLSLTVLTKMKFDLLENTLICWHFFQLQHIFRFHKQIQLAVFCPLCEWKILECLNFNDGRNKFSKLMSKVIFGSCLGLMYHEKMIVSKIDITQHTVYHSMDSYADTYLYYLDRLWIYNYNGK